MPTLSFIIVEYYSMPEIQKCVESIRKSSLSFFYEIIVSSNSNYSISEQNKIIHTNKDIHWIFNERNGGFAYAMNQGLKIAQEDILIIMNPDVQILTGVDSMINYLNFHENIGAIGPQIINDFGVIQDSARYNITIASFILRHMKRLFHPSLVLQEKSFHLDRIQNVDWVIGAFIMVKKEVYNITRGLDETYFLYCEDMDWCTRIRQHGYNVVYYPIAKIKYEGTRSARKSLRYSFIFIKSLFHYWCKFGFFNKI